MAELLVSPGVSISRESLSMGDRGPSVGGKTGGVPSVPSLAGESSDGEKGGGDCGRGGACGGKMTCYNLGCMKQVQ